MTKGSDIQKGHGSATTKDADKSVGVTGTWRQCYWSIDNETTNTLSFVAVAHMAGTIRNEMFWTGVGSGKSNTTLTINFKTGIGFDNDYWYIVFSFQDGNIYTGGGFPGGQLMCNLGSSDDGGTGYIRFNGDGSVECVPPSTSNDKFNVACQTNN